jgi:hypothetical protein
MPLPTCEVAKIGRLQASSPAISRLISVHPIKEECGIEQGTTNRSSLIFRAERGLQASNRKRTGRVSRKQTVWIGDWWHQTHEYAGHPQ